ncbi:MAG TPA: protein kinase [Kofleriaceae bacterium]|nr:protein kinase [Kofleriaceae bacterium]
MAGERAVESLLGRTLGEFVLRDHLGQGGFGAVYRAVQPALDREAVVKVMHSRLLDGGADTQRFLREARLASRLDHPYAAHIYAFGAERDGTLWIAMELVRGTPLDQLLRTQGPLPLERFVPLLERICEVVHTAHEQGIVHRDIKPANVMVLSRAGRLLPKLLDFGIAKGPADATARASAPPNGRDATADGFDAPHEGSLTDTVRSPPPRPAALAMTDTGLAALTQRGVVMGSPGYMAPEQWLDGAVVDLRSDIYALGVLAFESLVGHLPYTGTVVEVALAHAHNPVPSLGERFPPALDALLARALAKQPADRPASALELAREFRAASGVAAETVPLPRLDETVRAAVLADAPQPLAQAVAAFDAARNPHQARDALWQVVRVVVRLLGAIALASHSHVGADPGATDPDLADALRRLRSSALSDGDWLDIARELCRPFAAVRDAHPVPELVGFLLGDGHALVADLLAERAAGEGTRAGGEDQVRERLELLLPRVARVLTSVGFLADYRLVVATTAGAQVLMGARERRRPLLAGSAALVAGRPYLTDAKGAAAVCLWPFVQVHAPAPGVADAVFFFDGRGRRGARLVAFPDPFEDEDPELWEALGGMLGDTGSGDGGPSTEEVRPFPGLTAFTQDDASRFFGRERETHAFVNRLRVEPLLAVVGPSGAGKSSFVQAGVIPALPEGWRAVTVRPGPAPVASLAARLRGADIEPGDLRAALERDPDQLGALLAADAAARGGSVVLVIDQLEELFTVCEDATERRIYAEALVRAARSEADPVRVILTLRDDFLLRAEALPAFTSRLGHALELLTTPAERELTRILVEPVRRAGYQFDDPDLPAEMVAEVASAPGALALLSFTASKLWDLRDRRFRQLGRRAYTSLGGVGGALAQHAEAVLQRMHADEQRLVREVFRHAVTAAGTRAVLSRAELDEVLGGGPHAGTVVEKLVAARLLVVDSEAGAGSDRIEVIHEALLDAWPRLVTWRREDAEGARLRDQLRAAARQWEERGRASGLLWRGDALAELRLWRDRHPGALTSVEQAFADASLADAERERRVRRRLIGAGFAILTAIAVGLVIVSATVAGQRERAVASERQARDSAKRLTDLLRRQYESQGRRLALAGDPLQALAYLAKAGSMGVHGAAHDHLVAQALRDTDGELFEVHHPSAILRVRFSPDGARLATAGSDHDAFTWDAATGARTAALAHTGAARRIQYSPDGSMVLTASSDGSARLWDAATGRSLRALAEGVVTVQEALFSPDGRLALTLGVDDSVRLWRTSTGALVATLRGANPTSAITEGAGCAFSPDGARGAAADRAGGVGVWEVAGGRRVAELTGHGDAVSWLEFSPDGRTLATASADGSAGLWDVATGRRRAVLAHASAVNSIVFGPDGRQVVTSSEDHTAVVWDARTGLAVRTLGGHQAAVNLARFSPDGTQIATASTDTTVQLWDASTGRRLGRRLGHRAAIVDFVYDAEGRRLATAGLDGAAIVWSTEPQERMTPLAGAGAVQWAEFSASGAHVLTAGRDGNARIWDAVTGRELLALRGHQGGVRVARFSPDDRRIATAGDDGTVRIWDAARGTPQATLTGHGKRVVYVAWHPDGSQVISAGDDGTVRVWSVPRRQVVLSFAGDGRYPFYSAEFTPSGDAFVATSNDNTTHVVDAASGDELARYADADVRWRSAFDRTGARVISATFGQSTKIWRLRSGAVVTELVGHSGEVMTARFGAGDELAITASLDGTARIWDAAQGDLLAVLEPPGGPVRSASFSPDGKSVLTAGEGGAATWEVPRFRGGPGELDRLLRCRVPYTVEEEQVLPRRRDPSACAIRSPMR